MSKGGKMMRRVILFVAVLALVISAVVTALVTGENPLQLYAAIIDGSFGSARRVWMLLQNIYPAGGSQPLSLHSFSKSYPDTKSSSKPPSSRKPSQLAPALPSLLRPLYNPFHVCCV